MVSLGALFGHSLPAGNLREAAGWLESWVRLTTTRGQGGGPPG